MKAPPVARGADAGAKDTETFPAGLQDCGVPQPARTAEATVMAIMCCRGIRPPLLARTAGSHR